MNSNVKTNREPKSNRRKLYKLHTWVGFHLAFIMMVILATGTLATVSHEIDWLIQKEMRVTPGEEKVSWATMVNAVTNYAPQSAITNIQAMHGDYLAYRATVVDEDERRYYIYVDQWTGQVNGETGLITVQRFLRDMHRYLFMPKVIGLPIVSSMAFILLISLYTGLKTSRNWKTLMTRVRTNKGTRVMIGDAHKAAGLWSIWLIVLMAITSIWYLAELGSEITAYAKKNPDLEFSMSRPSLSDERLNSIGRDVKLPPIKNITDAAESAFPEIKGHITNIRFPLSPAQPIAVLGVRNNPLLRDRANRVFLDPETLEPLEIQRSESISFVAWLNEMADPLHFGYFGGLITKLIWFVFGLAVTSLSVTGVYLTWKRLKSKSTSRTQLATLPVLLLGALFAYFYWYPSYQAPAKPYSEHVLTHEGDQDIDLKLHLSLNKAKLVNGKLKLLLTGSNGALNTKDITVELYKDGQNLNDSKSFKLRRFAQTSIYRSTLPPADLESADSLIINVTLNNGEMINQNWPIAF